MDLNLLTPNPEVLNHPDWVRFSFKEFSKPGSKSVYSVPGVYVFYWTGDLDVLESFCRKIKLKGPNNSTIDLDLETTWFPNLGKNKYALYVGRTTNIYRRFGWHEYRKNIKEPWIPDDPHWKDERTNYHNPAYYAKIYKPTSTSQFRSGWQRLIRHLTKSNAEDLIDNVSFEFIPFLNNQEDLTKRFYIEDYLIGTLRPWFNLDSER